MNTKFIKDGLLWGGGLWLAGYVLGIVLFMVLPHNLIGWVIMPIGVMMTLFVLLKKIHFASLKHYLLLAIVWTVLAIILDYLLLVKLFKPADGYYKLDVYLYYLLTFILPIIVGWYKTLRPESQ